MQQLDRATEALVPPFAVLDLDAFAANAADLVRRAGTKPVRIASKSVRCRAVLDQTLAQPGFAGVMAYSVREAMWLVRGGVTDVFVAYPSIEFPALAEIAADDLLRSEITVTVDCEAHVGVLHDRLGERIRGLQVAVDVDASLHVAGQHLGAHRSPVRTPLDAVSVVLAAQRVGLRVVGLMFYDAQIAGIPDSSRAIRLMKSRSARELAQRRAAVTDAVRRVADLRFVNGGGTGSLDVVAGDSTLTEVAAGSGLYGTALFDGYADFTPQPALMYAVGVVRRPAPNIVTAFGGGYIASGEAGWSRSPVVVTPGLSLIKREGAGEVQTPFQGPGAAALEIGDRVWLRSAKAGEVLERFDVLHLVRGGNLVDTVATYRGEGQNFG